MISIPRGTDSITFKAFADVQQISVLALTSAVELTYMMTAASGCFSFKAMRSSAESISAMGQPAFGSGRMTFFWGERIEAVSAMKWTPEKMTTSCGRR